METFTGNVIIAGRRVLEKFLATFEEKTIMGAMLAFALRFFYKIIGVISLYIFIPLEITLRLSLQNLDRIVSLIILIAFVLLGKYIGDTYSYWWLLLFIPLAIPSYIACIQTVKEFFDVI